MPLDRPVQKPVIASDDLRAQELRHMFGRIARAEVGKHKEDLAKDRAEKWTARGLENAEADKEMKKIVTQIGELEKTINSRTLSPLLQKTAETTLGALQVQREILRTQAENLSNTPVYRDPGSRFENFHDQEHAIVRERISRTMEQVMRNELSLEHLLDACRGSSASGWSKSALEGFVPFLEKHYLGKRTLEDELEGLSAVPDSVRPAMEAEIRKAFSSAKSPDAAILAIREAVLVKNTLDPNQIRFILATFLARDLQTGVLFSLSDEDRELFVRYIHDTKSLSPEEQARLNKAVPSVVGYSNIPASVQKAKEHLDRDERRVGVLDSLEKRWKEKPDRDWALIAKNQFEQALRTDLLDLQSAFGDQFRLLDKVGKSLSEALKCAEDFRNHEDQLGLTGDLHPTPRTFAGMETLTQHVNLLRARIKSLGIPFQPLDSFGNFLAGETLDGEKTAAGLFREVEKAVTANGGLKVRSGRFIEQTNLQEDIRLSRISAEAIMSPAVVQDELRRAGVMELDAPDSVLEPRILEKRLFDLGTRIRVGIWRDSEFQADIREGKIAVRMEFEKERDARVQKLSARLEEQKKQFATLFEAQQFAQKQVDSAFKEIRDMLGREKVIAEKDVEKLVTDHAAAVSGVSDLEESLLLWFNRKKIVVAQKKVVDLLADLERARARLEMLNKMEESDLVKGK